MASATVRVNRNGLRTPLPFPRKFSISPSSFNFVRTHGSSAARCLQHSEAAAVAHSADQSTLSQSAAESPTSPSPSKSATRSQSTPLVLLKERGPYELIRPSVLYIYQLTCLTVRHINTHRSPYSTDLKYLLDRAEMIWPYCPRLTSSGGFYHRLPH